MFSAKILVVDDDQNLLELLKMRLESANYEVLTASREGDALEAVKGKVFDLSIVDLQLAHRDGISLMEEFHLILPEMPVIILTAYGTIESAVEAMRRGAYSYLTKPFDPRDLLFQIDRALENRRLNSEVQRLKGLLSERYGFSNIVAKSEKMQKVLEAVAQIAKIDSTVYIHGESGTGKELIAKAIHLASERKNKPFVAINCAAIPETLLESKLFGHEKGAFTGAIRSTKGLFTQAHEGTIFLDEIGDMSLPIQAKLLRVLQERQFYPVGSEKLVEVDVRVIVATNKELEDLVKQGLFREDLFYRIHVIPIYLPPLKERKEDIPPLVDHFLRKISQQMKKEVKGLSPSAFQRLMLHDWPGNVRELENTIEYAVAMTQQEILTEEYILQTKGALPNEPLKPLKEARDDYEKRYLVHLLEICRGNVSQAAKMAGKYRADFYDLLKKHNLNISEFKK
ncbi:MAG: two-component system response regulator GlrR [Deltaproteobacteria bacterium RBG_16_48_10]|nr:MAG: two-component system response regulator GlrR [Deltaproteobacteria bacterium RBG_16_48_10]